MNSTIQTTEVINKLLKAGFTRDQFTVKCNRRRVRNEETGKKFTEFLPGFKIRFQGTLDTEPGFVQKILSAGLNLHFYFTDQLASYPVVDYRSDVPKVRVTPSQAWMFDFLNSFTAYTKPGGFPIITVLARNPEEAFNRITEQLNRPENPSRYQLYTEWMQNNCYFRIAE